MIKKEHMRLNKNEKIEIYEKIIRLSRDIEKGEIEGCPPSFGKKSRMVAAKKLSELDREMMENK